MTRDERGDLGFGYDPIFFEPSEHATFAELSEKQKNAISHRAKAVQRLVEALKRERILPDVRP